MSTTRSPLEIDVDVIQKALNPIIEEEVLLDAIDQFIHFYGQEAFLAHYPHWQAEFVTKGEYNVSYSLLWIAGLKNYSQLANRLLAIGVPINIGSMSETASVSNLSPLNYAIVKQDVKMVELLIQHGADLLHVDGLKRSILMTGYDIPAEILNCIMTAAENQHCLSQLLEIKNFQNEDIFLFGMTKKIFLTLKLLIDKYPGHIPDIYGLLDEARRASLNANNYQTFREYDEICQKIRTLPTFKSINEARKFHSQTYSESYTALFGQDPGTQIDKVSALKKALAQIYTLLGSPMLCLDYLQDLNNKFKHYYEQTYQQPFPVLNKDQYEYRLINGVLYPIPKMDFVGLPRKHNALENFLMALFRPYELAQASYQWIGFVAPDLANEMVKNGDFIKETIYGIGLLHGRLAHMLQQALIILAYQEGSISRQYIDQDGNKQDLTVKDILGSFVEIMDKNKEATWMAIRDRGYQEHIAFCHPHRFSSFLMSDKSHHDWFDASPYDWQILTDSLVDSFCKNYRKLLDAFKISLSDLNVHLDTFTFASYLNDLTIRLFGTEKLTKYAIQQANIKKQGEFQKSLFAIAVKEYRDDNPYFMMQPYRGKLFNLICTNASENINKYLLEEEDINQLSVSAFIIAYLPDFIKHTPLTLAVRTQSLTCVQALIQHPRIDVNIPDSEGKTALFHAMYEENEVIVDILLSQQKIDPSIGSIETGTTPLNIAIQFWPAKFDQLLEKTRDDRLNIGFSALTQQLFNRVDANCTSQLKELITKNLSIPEPKTISHFTLLQHAIICKQIDIIKKLLMRGASTKVNENGIDVFALAALFLSKEACDEIVRLSEVKRTTTYQNTFLLFTDNKANKENIVNTESVLTPTPL